MVDLSGLTMGSLSDGMGAFCVLEGIAESIKSIKQAEVVSHANQ